MNATLPADLAPARLALPPLTGDDAPLVGLVRARPEDFRVDEVPAYAPEGSGDHLFVRFEKTGLDTKEAVRRIAGALDVDPREAGFAGLKDRHAITTQWASFLFGDAARLEGAEVEGVRVLEASRHRHKLRTGHLAANRFELFVRGARGERADEARARLETLARRGGPAYYGEQRFGRDGGNLDAARRWIVDGGRAPRDRFQKKLLVSTLQAAIFNELCAERVREGTMDGAIEGDLMRKEETGGLFVSEALELDRPRAERFEISATGPMVGAKMRWPEGEARAREEAALARWKLRPEDLERFRSSGEGTRRPYRVRIEDARLEVEPEGVRLLFTLPSGAYATIVLAELVAPA
jgi:tRNA pseudouridine13 synthase